MMIHHGIYFISLVGLVLQRERVLLIVYEYDEMHIVKMIMLNYDSLVNECYHNDY